MAFIYKIETVDGQIYIGQSKNEDSLKGRWYCHEKKWPGCHKEVIVTAPLEDLDELEILMIATFDSHRNGLNRTIGGSGIKNKFVTEETKEKRRKKMLGNQYGFKKGQQSLRRKPVYARKAGDSEWIKFDRREDAIAFTGVSYVTIKRRISGMRPLTDSSIQWDFSLDGGVSSTR